MKIKFQPQVYLKKNENPNHSEEGWYNLCEPISSKENAYMINDAGTKNNKVGKTRSDYRVKEVIV